ncbi:MAG: DUF6968 family protein [Gemmatimonadales bacterium]
MARPAALAQASYRAVLRNGTTRRVTVRIGAPHTAFQRDWACTAEITGWLKRTRVYGVDPLQALCLAVDLVGNVLYAQRREGVRLEFLSESAPVRYRGISGYGNGASGSADSDVGASARPSGGPPDKRIQLMRDALGCAPRWPAAVQFSRGVPRGCRQLQFRKAYSLPPQRMPAPQLASLLLDWRPYVPARS